MPNKKRKDGYIKKTFTVDHHVYYVYGKTQAELFEKEKAKREEIEQGVQKRKNPSISEYYDRWTDARRDSIKESTLRGQIKMFKAISEVYIPALSRKFGEIRINDITIDDLRHVQAELFKTRKSQTVNDYLAHLNHCMSDALKERVIQYNPCCLLNNLKRTEEKARDTHHRALSISEQKAFFECERCHNSYYYNVFRFAISTGMRCGEIGALKYSDIQKNIIHVCRTLTRTETGAYIVGQGAKTESGRRIIPMNDQIKEIVASQKELNTLLDGNVLSMDDLIFKAPERGYLMSTPMDREIKRICKVCGVEPFTMHAFRSTFATRAIESGMNVKTLQEILGHSNFNITMSLYGHCLTDTKKQAMDSIVIAI